MFASRIDWLLFSVAVMIKLPFPFVVGESIVNHGWSETTDQLSFVSTNIVSVSTSLDLMVKKQDEIKREESALADEDMLSVINIIDDFMEESHDESTKESD